MRTENDLRDAFAAVTENVPRDWVTPPDLTSVPPRPHRRAVVSMVLAAVVIVLSIAVAVRVSRGGETQPPAGNTTSPTPAPTRHVETSEDRAAIAIAQRMATDEAADRVTATRYADSVLHIALRTMSPNLGYASDLASRLNAPVIVVLVYGHYPPGTSGLGPTVLWVIFDKDTHFIYEFGKQRGLPDLTPLGPLNNAH